ncbi:hypothetical protein N9N26_01205 [Candidatus Poseidoniales archaeon]|jgi:DNA-directed RNA polymerase subunit A'|nr:hypothetical protein [Candidatus Poseidoniales archaeon]
MVDEIEEEIDWRVTHFWWPVREEQIYTSEINGRNYVELNFGAARWVPKTLTSAKKWVLRHPNSAGLREGADRLVIVKCKLSPTWDEFVESRIEQEKEVPEKDEGSYDPPYIEDQTPILGEAEEAKDGFRGAILPANFNYEIQIAPYDSASIIHLWEPKIKTLEVSMLSPEEIRQMSVVEVFEHEAYTQSRTEPLPIEHGVMDPRMGSAETGEECYTCGLTKNTNVPLMSCPGHFGHIELAAPIPNYLYLRSGNSYLASMQYPLSRTVNLVCHHCYHIRATDEQLEGIEYLVDNLFETEQNQFGSESIARLTREQVKNNHSKEDTKNKLFSCPRCEERSPEILWSHAYQTWQATPSKPMYEGPKKLDMGAVYTILENIPSEHHKYLGFGKDNKPSHMYWTSLPVAPVPIRPNSFTLDGNIDLNDLSKLYSNVVFVNNKIIKARQRNYDVGVIQRFQRELFRACTHVLTNQTSQVGSGGSNSIRDNRGRKKNVNYKGVMDRLGGVGRGKSRMRRIVQTKPVNSVSYSVLTPSPDLDVDEIGVSYSTCMTVTVEEEVTEENRERLKEAVINGSPNMSKGVVNTKDFSHYPGAGYIVRGGLTRDEDPMRTRFSLQDQDSSNVLALMDFETYVDESDIKIEEMGFMEKKKLQKDFFTRWNRERRENMELEIGDIVGRHLINGDWGLFNRAPSLHRQSIMAFKVVPMKTKSIAFNPTICIPFNADYDGDAGKVHFVQSLESIKQAEEIMHLDKNVIHGRYGKLTVATDQDETSGLALMTMPIISRAGEFNLGVGYTTDEAIPFFNRSRTVKLLASAWYRTEDGGINYPTEVPEPDYKHSDGKMYWTGRLLLSSLIPDGINATFKGNNPERNSDGSIKRETTSKQLYNGEFKGKEIKETVVILDGQIIQGTLDKTAFGEGGASIAPAFFYLYGYEEGFKHMKKFIMQFTRMAFAAHLHVGYSIGTGDCSLMDFDVREEISRQYELAAKKMTEFQLAYDERRLEKLPDLNLQDRAEIRKNPLDWVEDKIKSIASEFEGYVTEYVSDKVGPSNPIQIAVRSKARGKPLNIQQMSAAYGQVAYGGKRPIFGINNHRVLPHYPVNGYPPEHPRNKGFIDNCYGTGMEPDQFWLASAAGRRSLAESSQGAIAKAGHLEYQLKRSLEDVVVDENQNAVDVRDGTIVSFNLGGDGLRPHHIRGDGHEQLSSKGKYIVLQPLLFEFDCKHGNNLAQPCGECEKSMNLDTIFSMVAHTGNSCDKLIEFLDGREILKPMATKLSKRYLQWFEESKCTPGEAIGANAAANIGEPIAQAGLRSFHGGGKFSSGGTVKGISRVVTISGGDNPDAFTLIYLKPEYTKTDAEAIARFCGEEYMDNIIDSVDYGTDTLSIVVDGSYMDAMGIDRGFTERQIRRVFGRDYPIEKSLKNGDELVIKVPDASAQELLIARDMLLSIRISGIDGAEFAVSEFDDELGLWRVRIRGPRIAKSSGLWKDVHELLGDFILPALSWTSEYWVVYQQLGLEAFLDCVYEQIDNQMNDELGGNGMGEFDHRYIQVMVDRIGQKGYPVTLTPDRGWGGAHSQSFLHASAGEAIFDKISAGATMQQTDQLRGMVESVTVGSIPRIGPDFRLD